MWRETEEPEISLSTLFDHQFFLVLPELRILILAAGDPLIRETTCFVISKIVLDLQLVEVVPPMLRERRCEIAANPSFKGVVEFDRQPEVQPVLK